MKTEKELRFAGELRASDDAPRRLAGYAALYNVTADIGSFEECIRPGAFRGVLSKKPDCRLLIDHDSSRLLARTASGTLALSEDAKGLAFVADLPDTTIARDCYELVKRQDLSGCSFAFTVARDDWPSRDRREIIEIGELFDVSVCAWPAYEQTSVAARNLSTASEYRSVGTYPSFGRHARISLREAREETARLLREVKNESVDDGLRFRLRLAKLK
jgi:HK97 family phage prohead protease